jgi:hypothetical protein
MARAQLAAGIRVDRLCWELTDHPEDAYSRRFGPGSPALDAIRREIWDDNNLGNAIPGATPRARIDVRTLVPGIPIDRAPAAPCRSARACTTCRRARSRRRRPTAGAWCASAPSSARKMGRCLNRDFARAWLPRRLTRDPADVAIEIPAPEQPGRYALKFDLVSEGIDWFEKCGSPTTTRSLWVR